MAYVASDGFRVSNIKNPANQKASAYWMWFKHEGREQFKRKWGVPHEQTNLEHKAQIMEWWDEAKHNKKWKLLADQFNNDPEKVKQFREEKKIKYRQALAENPEAMFELKRNHDAKIAQINPAKALHAFGASMKPHYGRALFCEKYGEDYDGDNRADHRNDITEMWNAVRYAEGGWDAAAKKAAPPPKRREERVERPPFPFREEPTVLDERENAIRRIGRKIFFMKHTPNEVDIRAAKSLSFNISRFGIKMKSEAERSRKSEDDVLRDLHSFLLVVNEYTSNIKGDRTCPSEVTLLSYSLTRGMKKELSRIVLFKQAIVTDSDNLNEIEYNTLLESYDKTGIASERYITGETNPSGIDVTTIERLKSEILQQLNDRNNRVAPIMFLKSNYNQAAGMLFTLFPDVWEHLEARFCFLDDMFKIYTKIQKGHCDIHPIRDYRNLPTPPPCSFHKRVRDKECTLQLAVTELQFLFKNLSDAKVLDMHNLYNQSRHLKCVVDSWDRHEAPIEWGDMNLPGMAEAERRRQEDRRSPMVSPGALASGEDDDSDDSLDEDLAPRVAAQSLSSGFGNPQHSRNNSGNDGRGSNRYEGGYGGNEEYSNREKENRRHEPQRSTGFGNAINHERDSTNGSVYQGRDARDRSPPGYSRNDNRPMNNGPPPGFEDRDARPAQRRRQASPTYSEMGRGDGRNEEKWRDSLRSQEDLRSSHGGERSTAFTRPTAPRGGGGGGGVFGSRPVVAKEPPRPLSREESPPPAQPPRRGVFGSQQPRPVPQPVYTGSFGGSDSVPVTSRPRGDQEQIDHAIHQRRLEKQERDARMEEDRRREARGGRQTMRDHAVHSPPPREGEKGREDRLNPLFGESSSSRGNNDSSSNFFRQGVMPTALHVPGKKEPVAKPETAEEAREREEDEMIRQTIKFLPRGSFDNHMKQLREAADPRITPVFRPYLWSASKESGGLPMHPKESEECEDKIRRAIHRD